MDVQEDARRCARATSSSSTSYDLGVDIELADAIQRLRFEHPEVQRGRGHRAARTAIFCAGANIYMLGSSTHPFKVNFCKFTNETRLVLEDACARTAACKFLAALQRHRAPAAATSWRSPATRSCWSTTASRAVSLPEVPLLGVLPGTGGLTRVVDKRKVRRDLRRRVLAPLAEGVKGKRAVRVGAGRRGRAAAAKFAEAVAERAQALRRRSRPREGAARASTLHAARAEAHRRRHRATATSR